MNNNVNGGMNKEGRKANVKKNIKGKKRGNNGK